MTGAEFEQLFQTCVNETREPYAVARDALRDQGDEAVPPLLAKVSESSDDDWLPRIVAQMVLGWIVRTDLYEQVGHILRRPGRTAGPRPVSLVPAPTAAAVALSGLGADVVPRLIEILVKTHEWDGERESSAVMLALDYLRDRRAVMPLLDLAAPGGDARRRMLAMSTLGGLGDQAAFEVAKQALDDRGNSARLRGMAAVCLGRIGDPAAGQALRAAAAAPVARNAAVTTEDLILRQSAIRAMGYLGAPGDATELKEMLDQESNVALGLELVGALTRLREPEALRQCGNENTVVREAAEEAARSLSGPGY
ncbi:HEAT repeat domain-containing protein [Nonomuraea solani]|nr:HEAT repeat domain-containing protein [Nonomuraea solani]